jgi:hypothetical protein
LFIFPMSGIVTEAEFLNNIFIQNFRIRWLLIAILDPTRPSSYNSHYCNLT